MKIPEGQREGSSCAWLGAVSGEFIFLRCSNKYTKIKKRLDHIIDIIDD